MVRHTPGEPDASSYVIADADDFLFFAADLEDQLSGATVTGATKEEQTSSLVAVLRDAIDALIKGGGAAYPGWERAPTAVTHEWDGSCWADGSGNCLPPPRAGEQPDVALLGTVSQEAWFEIWPTNKFDRRGFQVTFVVGATIA